MWKRCITALALLAVTSASPSPIIAQGTTNRTSPRASSGVLPCDALEKAGLGDRLLYPTDDAYEPQIATWWALNSRQHPYCLLLPHSTQEVATAITVLGSQVNLGAGDWHVAVKGGGHASTQINNIDQGVTIDLSFMNATSYNTETNVARIQPGGRWKDVYADLQEYNVVAAGGRDGGVGVGGFFLGGGISFYQASIGYSCDTIVNYEIVLGNGSIVNANRSWNPDLYTALKGGSSNFGIVTRFDVTALPSYNMAYEVKTLASNASDILIEVIEGFAKQGPELADDALIAFYEYKSSVSPGIYITAIHVNTNGKTNTTSAYNKLDQVPVLSQTSLKQSMASAAQNSQIPGGTWNTGTTLTFKNDPAIMRETVQYYSDCVNNLKVSIGPDTFNALLFFEPVPAFTGNISKAAGGNMLGLQDVTDNYILYVVGIAVNGTAAQAAIGQSEVSALSARVKKLTEEKGGSMDFVYLNYADASQDPIGSYGSDNIEHIRKVAKRYDPRGVFQTKFSQGFKISRVGMSG